MPLEGKRIILCLDGTWVNSDKGYNRPTAQDPNESLAIPTNVTRVYRALRKRGFDGESQIMYYHPGVGSTGGLEDSISGGVFGTGVAEVNYFRLGFLHGEKLRTVEHPGGIQLCRDQLRAWR